MPAPSSTSDDSPKSGGVRVSRTVSITPDQDRWLTEEFLGERGNFSALVQAVIDALREGALDPKPLLKNQKDRSTQARAEAYLKAKEAAMVFEEDVSAAVMKWLGTKRGLRVSRNRIHNGTGTFIADISIEQPGGAVVCSVVCKSNPRPDRLQLALAEAMIGNQKTGRPVISVVPYLTPESADAADKFKLNGYKLVVLADLIPALDRAAKE